MSESVTLGLVRIGAIDLAIPSEFIAEVLQGPITLSPFPHAPVHVLGAFAPHGEAVPVIDLATLIRPAEAVAARPVAYVVVLHCPRGRFAILVDEVLGVVRTHADRVTTAATQGDHGLFSEIYTPPDGTCIAAVLDLDAVLSVAGVRSSTPPARAIETSAATATGATAEGSLVLFHAGTSCFAIDADLIQTVEPRPAILDTVMPHPPLLGFHRFRGENLPVVDLRVHLGLPPAKTTPNQSYVVVLRTAAFCVDGLGSIRRVDPARLHLLPAGAMANPEFYTGSFIEPATGVVFVLSVPGMLRALGIEGQVGSRDQRAGATADLNAGASGEVSRFLVFRAGGITLAVALKQLQSVMRIPPDFVDMRVPGRPLAGFCPYQNQTVHLIDLGVMLGSGETPLVAGGFVLCTSTPTGVRGFLIDGFDMLAAAVPRPLPGRDRRNHATAPPCTHMIRAQSPSYDRSACILDLDALAGTLESIPMRAAA